MSKPFEFKWDDFDPIVIFKVEPKDAADAKKAAQLEELLDYSTRERIAEIANAKLQELLDVLEVEITDLQNRIEAYDKEAEERIKIMDAQTDEIEWLRRNNTLLAKRANSDAGHSTEP